MYGRQGDHVGENLFLETTVCLPCSHKYCLILYLLYVMPVKKKKKQFEIEFEDWSGASGGGEDYDWVVWARGG